MARHKANEEIEEEIEGLQRLETKLDELAGQVNRRIEHLDRATDRRVSVARTMPAQKPGKSKQNYGTPMEFIAAVEKQFGPIVHDLAAEEGNQKATSYYSKEQDCFKQDWAKDFPCGNLWLNPEFANIAPYAKKCGEESVRRVGRILLLTPASVGAEWFAAYVEGKALVLPLRPRLSFDGKNPYPKDTMLSVFGVDPGFKTWRWK